MENSGRNTKIRRNAGGLCCKRSTAGARRTWGLRARGFSDFTTKQAAAAIYWNIAFVRSLYSDGGVPPRLFENLNRNYSYYPPPHVPPPYEPQTQMCFMHGLVEGPISIECHPKEKGLEFSYEAFASSCIRPGFFRIIGACEGLMKRMPLVETREG